MPGDEVQQQSTVPSWAALIVLLIGIRGGVGQLDQIGCGVTKIGQGWYRSIRLPESIWSSGSLASRRHVVREDGLDRFALSNCCELKASTVGERHSSNPAVTSRGAPRHVSGPRGHPHADSRTP
jgi:hypothetical protein